MLPALLIAALALQAWVWSRLAARVRSGRLSIRRAVARYAGAALLPFVGLAAAFFALVGLEEWLGLALLSEPLSRATPLAALLLIAFFVAGSTFFAVWCAYMRSSHSTDQGS